MIEYVFYLTFAVINAIIVFEDLKIGKIRNFYVLILLLISILFIIYNYFEMKIEPISILEKILLSVGVAIFMWLVGFWPSGDSKLFIVWSIFLSPLKNATFELNVLLPLFFIFFPFVLINTTKKKLISSLKKTFSGYRVYSVFTVFFGFSWLLMKVFQFLNLPQNFIIYFAIAFFMIEIVSKFAPFSLEVSYFIFCLVRLFLDPSVYTLEFWIRFIELILTYLIFVFLFLDLSLDLNTKTIKINKLKPGMVLFEGIVKKMENGKVKYEKQQIPLSIFSWKINFIHNISDDGLTEEDVKLIKGLYKAGKIKFDEIKIHKPMPFAIFIVFGGFITLFFKANIIHLIKLLYYNLLKNL